jgi:hypothetical protein
MKLRIQQELAEADRKRVEDALRQSHKGVNFTTKYTVNKIAKCLILIFSTKTLLNSAG